MKSEVDLEYGGRSVGSCVDGFRHSSPAWNKVAVVAGANMEKVK